MIHDDNYFMAIAIAEAMHALENDEIPIGAVVVCNGQVVGRGHNMTERLGDVTAHAEMMAITSAEQTLGGKYLADCTLYVTVEPCLMCAGAIAWAQVKRIVYGAGDSKRGYSTYTPTPFHPRATVTGGVMEEECAKLMKDFFARRR
ncbi:MAG: nucleoside deaminase [Clostridiales bacterium]|nr:nucleoside deaminase [Clostridiales bacterium]